MIPLVGEGCRGLLKEVVREFGADLRKLIDMKGILEGKFYLRGRRRELHLRGSAEGLASVRKLVLIETNILRTWQSICGSSTGQGQDPLAEGLSGRQRGDGRGMLFDLLHRAGGGGRIPLRTLRPPVVQELLQDASDGGGAAPDVPQRGTFINRVLIVC